MTKTLFSSAALALLAALAAAPAQAQLLNNAATVAPSATIAKADVRWMERAARAGIAEVEAGKLAANQGKRDEVRNFGTTMADHHAKANEELIAIAQQKRVLLPNKADRSHLRELKKLASLAPDKFDAVYMRDLGIRDHTNAAKLFEDGIAKLEDPDLKAYAARTLPIIKRHFEMARDINVTVQADAEKPKQ